MWEEVAVPYLCLSMVSTSNFQRSFILGTSLVDTFRAWKIRGRRLCVVFPKVSCIWLDGIVHTDGGKARGG